MILPSFQHIAKAQQDVLNSHKMAKMAECYQNMVNFINYKDDWIIILIHGF